MNNTFGQCVTITLFGESHGTYIGAVLDGIAPGLAVNEDHIRSALDKRRGEEAISTTRREPDTFDIISGVYNGLTTGTPLCVLIHNTDIQDDGYITDRQIPRPGHADYTAICKYDGYADLRGGGHFSGRLTAPLVLVGTIIKDALAMRGIAIGTHILQCIDVKDDNFTEFERDICYLNDNPFPCLSENIAQQYRDMIRHAGMRGDSLGGILETAVCGLPVGLGEPWFDNFEGVLSHALFSIPAIKGVEFGSGFSFGEMTGSEASDPLQMREEKVITACNHNGGINGGITNGMPLLFRCAVKPTPSIAQPQMSVDLSCGKAVSLEIKGRHDPAIFPRAAVVVDSVTALVIADFTARRFGSAWLRG